MEFISRREIQSFWDCQHVDWLYLGSIGAFVGGGGGVLETWDRRTVEKFDEVMGQFYVSCKFKNIEDQFEWAFTSIYGPNSNLDQRLLWEELVGIRSWWSVPWCFGGDSNVVRFPSKCFGSGPFSSTMIDFSDFISEQGLVDLPLEEGTFTWSNSREVVSRSRLDKFLLSSDWEEHFLNIRQRRLQRLPSDHFTILVDGGNF